MDSFKQFFRSFAVVGSLVVLGFALGTASQQTAADTLPEAVSVQPALSQQTDSTTDSLLSETELTRADIYENVAPSVVSIQVLRPSSSLAVFGQQQGGVVPETTSGGTGFILDTDGHIMTNYHVVVDASEVFVKLIDGTQTTAEIIGLDADSDLAVIKIDVPADRLRPVTFGNVDNLRVGQDVVAIGSPFSQDWTMTSGIISATNRSLQGLGSYSIGSVIQTDTSINPGNSGGPLLNMRGEVIGVTSQIQSSTRSNSGVGFAIPAVLVQRVAEELIETGKVAYSYIGISGQDVTLNVIRSRDLANNQTGFVVCSIERNSPATQSELIPDRYNCQPHNNGDIIVSINGEETRNFEALITYLAHHTRPNDTVTFGVLRGDEVVEVEVTLGERVSVPQTLTQPPSEDNEDN